MTDDVFDADYVVDKLSKLNSSQQSIESLSRWCISHRKKARRIVEFWDKAFHNAQREQRVSFLYLANDILQNSRRKGSEFVNEFWKFLPAALKHVCQNGDEHGKKAACRLVDIWEERKVFGSRGRNLKDEMLGKDPLPSAPASTATSAVSNGKSSNPIKIVKRDSESLRIKLAVGDLPEKIITAFQLVHDENVTVEGALSNCKAAVSVVEKLEKDVEYASTQGNLQGSAPVLVDELKEQENVITLCIRQLENAESTVATLVSQLKEALQEQEMQLDFVHKHLQVAHGQIDHLSNMRQRLMSSSVPASLTAAIEPPNLASAQPTTAPPLLQPVSFSAPKISEEDNKKAAAAAVAAKLAASTASAQMLTSIFSSLVAEEAASKSSGLGPQGFSSDPPMFSPEKRQKVEAPLPASDINKPEMAGNVNYSTSQQQMTSMPPVPPTSMQMTFPPPPPPHLSQTNSPTNQFIPSNGMMMGVMPYGYGSSNLPPPPPPLPLSSYIAMGLPRPSLQPPLPQSQSPQLANVGYYRPPGIGIYGQNHQATIPPVSRQ